MTELHNRQAVQRFWNAIEAKDLRAAAAELHEEFIEDWPQSGERIQGAHNWLSMATHHPSFPSSRHVRTIGRDDLWVTHAAFEYAPDGSAHYEVCSVQECRDGKIARITEFFAAPFEAAAWRAAWVGTIAP
jgi:hypothetical protein